MLAHERREAILQALMRTGRAAVAELAGSLDVSEMTIRRDLTRLAEQELVEKVHGGAVLPRRSSMEPHFLAKRQVNAAEKAAIATAAVELVTDSTTIAISPGTTTTLVAERLRGQFRDLTFVTNSVNIAMALEASGWKSIVMSGGSFRTPSDALVGPVAVRSLRGLNSDVLFLGVHSVDPGAGLTTPNLAEAETNRVLVERARRVVVVADSSKLGHVSLATFATADEVDILITDTGADRQVLDALRAAGVAITLVKPLLSPGGLIRGAM